MLYKRLRMHGFAAHSRLTNTKILEKPETIPQQRVLVRNVIIEKHHRQTW